MFAGLPGTGIGGVFYLLLTLWMPINEAYLASQGRSSLARWKFIGVRWSLFALVIAVMWVQVELLRSIFPQGAPAAGAALIKSVGSSVGIHVTADTTGGLLFASTLYAGLVLFAVIVVVHLARLAIWYRKQLTDLAYQDDLAGEWGRFKTHIADHSADVRETITDVWSRARVMTRRQTPRYR